MDEQTLQTMPEYVQKLPKEIRDFVFDGEWERRTKEIALKYSLDEQQTDSLVDKVLYVLIGLDSPDTFQKEITSELFMSNLLASQIMEELGERVFDYALKEIDFQEEKPTETENKETVEEPKKELVAQEILPTSVSTPRYTPPPPTIEKIVPKEVLPEIPPNLPGIAVEDRPETKPTPDTSSAPGIIDWSRLKSDAAKEKPLGEKVQAPLGVPRFSQAAPEETSPAAPAQNATTGDPANSPTTPPVGQNPLVTPTVSTPTAPAQPAPKKYSVDPYREPIE